jgi:hypothetical protein
MTLGHLRRQRFCGICHPPNSALLPRLDKTRDLFEYHRHEEKCSIILTRSSAAWTE